MFHFTGSTKALSLPQDIYELHIEFSKETRWLGTIVDYQMVIVQHALQFGKLAV